MKSEKMSNQSRRNILVLLQEKMYLFANYPLSKTLHDFRKDVLAHVTDKKHSSILLGLVHDGSILKDSDTSMKALLVGERPIIYATVVPVTPPSKSTAIFPESLGNLYRILNETLAQSPIEGQAEPSPNTPSET